MFNESSFYKLGARARLEQPPRVDVANQVLARLRSQTRIVTIGERPLAWIAAIAAAAAAPIAAGGVYCWTQLTNPLMQAFYAMAW